jgi:hypothetical protein
MSKIEVDAIEPQSGTSLTVGASGDTVTVPSGVTLDTSNSTLTLPDNSVTTNKIADSNITLAKLSATGTKDATTFLRGDNSFAVAGGIFESQLLHVRDEKSAGTASGTATSGSFQTRVLNTVMTNEISGASLASNQITLPSGTYFVYANAQLWSSGRGKIKLRNVTDSSDTIIGGCGYSASGAAGITFFSGRFTIGASKTFELQHRNETTKSGDGYGVEANYGVVEVFADVQIWKVA